MPFHTSSSVSRLTQRACLALGLACAIVLSACGSGSTFEPLVPTRIISFGDGLSDVGNTPGGGKFTVNDGTVNIWVERVAVQYGATLTASVKPGGLGFAQGNARITDTAAQITTFLGANSIGASDLIIIDAGVAELAALALANPADAALVTAADVAGRELAAQVLRVTAAGGKRVVIANAIDLGKTPFAAAQSRAAGFTAATRAFNDSLKIALANVTSGVFLIDNEGYVNALYNNPANLGAGGNATVAACSTPTAQTCNTSTFVASVTNYQLHLFADDRHLAPAAHRLLGDNAYNRIRARW